MQMDVAKEDSPQVSLGNAQSQGGVFSFRHPIHLRESVGYVVRIVMSQQSDKLSTTALYGAEHNAATFTEGSITLTLAPGVFVHSILFV